jgi:excisionase family DNA binding protein
LAARPRKRAADLLGVGCPTIVALIDDNVLPAERIGNRYRLLLDDVLTYRESRRKRQYDALAATAVDVGSDEDPATSKNICARRRRAIAQRRRSAHPR